MKMHKIIADLRKEQGWSQADLASRSGVSQVMIGKYERGIAVPSLEVAKKLADAFKVSIDFLVGEGINANYDQKTLKRIEELVKLDPDTQKTLFTLIDTVIRDAKARKAYA